MSRPPTAGRRPTTSRPMTRQPGPSARTTGAAGGPPPGTSRPESRGGAAAGGSGVLDSRINVADRPITQQGLGGMKMGPRKLNRMVRDQSYFLGLLRTKIHDLESESAKLQKEVDHFNQENSQYLSYEKTAEALAAELKDLQGHLGDYNTLVDKLNTDTEMDVVLEDFNELKVQNDMEAKSIDAIFTERQEKEQQIQLVEVEIDQCKRMADSLVDDMSPTMKNKYMQLKVTNETLLRDLEAKQQELDALNTKRDNLEDELSTSQVKQEAVRLYEQLHELEAKKASIVDEEQQKGSPAEERERLLKQVKEDNQEIASMERQIQELKEQINNITEEIQHLEMDLEEHQGERNMKYKELKKREETMNEFLESFEETKSAEMERKTAIEGNILALLEHTSRSLGRTKHMPTPQELARMQEDLSFKENEMQKSQATASGLATESTRLHMDLQKVEQLETKINAELETLRDKIKQMNEELKTYSDLDSLKKQADDKKKKLHEDKMNLMKRRDTFKKFMQELSSQYEALKAQLNDNETHLQLGNLERKWQHHEQNNFVMKEFIAAKSMESDYRPTVKNVKGMLAEYNKIIQDSVGRGLGH
ncbi:intraflagellar transport protein 74 homolog [Saccoglossus kowalevskii]|uniref:Intraflagellar transport protein 74 homolog n=1 Tax=Saccoglossus kowalevskii TaxID=10224 RepID=A0A0U2U2E3_SACKO|nr:PREDICTED: intraflagellar transport protein 74 homolog [Saccoglossus kowalevskii]ALR88556.1 intraflagellar transport protein 74-homolog223 [Saccoglossus kowalevskii]